MGAEGRRMRRRKGRHLWNMRGAGKVVVHKEGSTRIGTVISGRFTVGVWVRSVLATANMGKRKLGSIDCDVQKITC